MFSCGSFLIRVAVGVLWASCVSALPERDPTLPSDYNKETAKTQEAVSVTTYVLDATLISDDSKFAIINNSIVKVGDMIGDQKVKSIDPYSVTLVGTQGEVVLHLFGIPIKEPLKEINKEPAK